MNRSLDAFRLGVKAAVGAHLVLSLSSLAYGALATDSEGRPYWKDDEKETFDAAHYKVVTDLVSDIYGGGGKNDASFDGRRLGGQHRGAVLTEGVTFEDPAAICSTEKEVWEAFRALRVAMNPRSLEKPKCVDVRPRGESIDLTYRLHQRYTLLATSFSVRSLLVVSVQLGRIHGTPDSEMFVSRIEERWNGIPPLGGTVFRMVRRINGIISWNLTTRLLPEPKNGDRI